MSDHSGLKLILFAAGLEQQARIKELEAENQRLRDALVKIKDLEYKNYGQAREYSHGIAVAALLGGGE